MWTFQLRSACYESTPRCCKRVNHNIGPKLVVKGHPFPQVILLAAFLRCSQFTIHHRQPPGSTCTIVVLSRLADVFLHEFLQDFVSSIGNNADVAEVVDVDVSRDSFREVHHHGRS